MNADDWLRSTADELKNRRAAVYRPVKKTCAYATRPRPLVALASRALS